jgi:hypothetical protein
MGVLAIVVYFVPTIIGAVKGADSLKWLFLTNLLTGWTMAGWIVCFIWSLFS